MRSGYPKIKYFLYARKSSESEDRQIVSIDSQIKHMRELADKEPLEIIDTFSEARSAKAPGRPTFNEMLRRISKGEAQGILCWKLDRLARNPVDGGQVSWLLQRGVIQRIRTHDRDYCPSDNVLMMGVEFGMANQYVRDLSAAVKRGLTDKAAMGWYPVQPPLGYLNDGAPGRGRRRIIKDEQRFPLVRKIFDLVLTGAYSVPQVLDTATHQWGLRTRRGKMLSESNLYALLGNLFYYGIFEFPRGSGAWYRGAHPPMITEEEYDRVQTLLGRKDRPRPKRHSFSFTGTMRCGECGAAITAEEKTKRQKNGNVHRYVYYHCTKRKHPHCTQRCVEENGLIAQVIGILGSLSTTQQFYAYALKWFRREFETEMVSQKDVLASQQEAHDACTQKLDKLIDMRAAEQISEDEFSRKRLELLKVKTRYEALLNSVDDRNQECLAIAEDMLTFIRHAKERLKNGTPDQRREILLALGSNPTLIDQKLALELQKPLIAAGRVAFVVHGIHDRLEPPKNGTSQPNFEVIYARSPVVQTLLQEVRNAIRSLSGYSPFRIVANWQNLESADSAATGQPGAGRPL